MKKTLPAFMAALLITILIGSGMLVIGQDALNTSTVQAAAAQSSSAISAETTAQFQQALSQYQTRETQYQAELAQAIEKVNAANQQVELANQQIQEYQSLLTQLQNSGLITISSDGTVTVNQAGNQSAFAQPPAHHGGNH